MAPTYASQARRSMLLAGFWRQFQGSRPSGNGLTARDTELSGLDNMQLNAFLPSTRLSNNSSRRIPIVKSWLPCFAFTMAALVASATHAQEGVAQPKQVILKYLGTA